MSGKGSLGDNSHDNKTINIGDRNHFSAYFDEIVESLKVHAAVMGPDHVQRIKEKLENNPELLASFQTIALFLIQETIVLEEKTRIQD